MDLAAASPRKDADSSPPPSFASAVLRRLSHLESKFSSQIARAQQEAERLRESTLTRAVALAKDAAMADRRAQKYILNSCLSRQDEFSFIMKGMSEVLQSQLRRMDHLEAQWREAEPLHWSKVPVPDCDTTSIQGRLCQGEVPVRDFQTSGLQGRLCQVEELLERCCQHEEALGSELLQLARRLLEVELVRGAASQSAAKDVGGGHGEQEANLEAMLSSMQLKIDVLQQDSHDLQARVEAQEERGRCLRALTDAKDEHYRSLVERFERASVEPRLKHLQAQSRAAESQLSLQAEAIELLTKRLDDEVQISLQAQQSPRLAKSQGRLEQRVAALESQVEDCWKGLDQASGCLGQLEDTFLKHFSRSGVAGTLKAAKPMVEEPETRLPGAVDGFGITAVADGSG